MKRDTKKKHLKGKAMWNGCDVTFKDNMISKWISTGCGKNTEMISTENILNLGFTNETHMTNIQELDKSKSNLISHTVLSFFPPCRKIHCRMTRMNFSKNLWPSLFQPCLNHLESTGVWSSISFFNPTHSLTHNWCAIMCEHIMSKEEW